MTYTKGTDDTMWTKHPAWENFLKFFYDVLTPPLKRILHRFNIVVIILKRKLLPQTHHAGGDGRGHENVNLFVHRSFIIIK